MRSVLAIDPLLTLLFCGASLVFFAGTNHVGRITRAMQKDILSAVAAANGRATQAISLLRTVRSLGGEEKEAREVRANLLFAKF